MELIRVYASSPASAVAGAITGVILEYHEAEVQAVGADAANQAFQAVALAARYLKDDGILVTCAPEFQEVTVENKVRTAIRLVVKPAAGSKFSPKGFSAVSHGPEFAPVGA